MSAILVTGAARRIGRALALGLAARGHDIYAHYNSSSDEVGSLAAEIRALGRECLPVGADLGDADAASGLLQECRRLGTVDHLINNAALYIDDPLEGFSVASFDRQMAVNLRAPLILVDAFARQAPQGGSVLNMLDSRIAALPGRFISYMATKSALAGATEMLALRHAPRLRVNAIAPGPMLPNGTETAGQIATYQARTPLAAPLDTADIVEAAAYLVQARTVTGQILYIDGGQRFTSRRSF